MSAKSKLPTLSETTALAVPFDAQRASTYVQAYGDAVDVAKPENVIAYAASMIDRFERHGFFYSVAQVGYSVRCDAATARAICDRLTNVDKDARSRAYGYLLLGSQAAWVNAPLAGVFDQIAKEAKSKGKMVQHATHLVVKEIAAGRAAVTAPQLSRKLLQDATKAATPKAASRKGASTGSATGSTTGATTGAPPAPPADQPDDGNRSLALIRGAAEHLLGISPAPPVDQPDDGSRSLALIRGAAEHLLGFPQHAALAQAILAALHSHASKPEDAPVTSLAGVPMAPKLVKAPKLAKAGALVN